MHGPLPEATQSPSTTVHIKFVPPVSSLLSLVEAQTRATRASTSVIFAPCLRCCILMPSTSLASLASTCFMHNIDLHEIFECAHLNFTISGRSKDSSKHTHAHVQCSHASVGLTQARPRPRGSHLHAAFATGTKAFDQQKVCLIAWLFPSEALEDLIFKGYSWSIDFSSSEVTLIPWSVSKRGFDHLIQFWSRLLHGTYKWLPFVRESVASFPDSQCILNWFIASLLVEPGKEATLCHSNAQNKRNPV